MKRIHLLALLLALMLLAGCARTASGPDVLDPDGVGALPQGPANDELAPATAEPEPTEAPSPAPKATEEPKATDKPEATDEPAAADEPESAGAPEEADEPKPAAFKAGKLSENDLVTAMNAALSFYGDWIYNASKVIDPAAEDPASVAHRRTGDIQLWPVKEGTFSSCDELFAAACRHFHEEIADVFLDEIGAQDVDGVLCVGRADVSETLGFLCELTMVPDQEEDAYSFDLSYTTAAARLPADSVSVRYELRDGQWAFAGRPSALHQFFSVLMSADDLVVHMGTN